MYNSKHMKLGAKINLVLIAVTVVVLTIAFSVVVNIESKMIKTQILNDQRIVGTILQNNISNLLGGDSLLEKEDANIIAKRDLLAVQNITNDIKELNFFHNLVVFDKDLKFIIGTTGEEYEFEESKEKYGKARRQVVLGEIPEYSIEDDYEDGKILVHIIPLASSDGEIIGGVEIRILSNIYKGRITDLKVRMLLIGIIFTIILVAVLAFILRREIVRPIMLYSLVAQKVADGDLDQKIEYSSEDEIGRFANVFNTMVANLREFDRLKSDFISVAAHQLRTPLSGVKWVLKLLLDGDLGTISSEQLQMVKRGYETNEKMIQLVNDLLNVSRIENGKFGYDFKENNFGKLLTTLIENSELATKERGIAVTLDKRFDPGVFIFDAEKLLIAFQNLVDNAIKYTLPNGKVTITTEKQGDYVQVKVQDSGVGIPKDEIHKLFSKFFRATNVIHLQTDGSGLGLFIVKNIVLRHGGQIWVDSVEGQGTTFTVIIPLIEELLPKEPEGGNLDLSGKSAKSGNV